MSYWILSFIHKERVWNYEWSKCWKDFDQENFMYNYLFSTKEKAEEFIKNKRKLLRRVVDVI